jgi:nitroreductase
MEFFDVVKARRSVRSYADAPVEREKLDAIVEAIRLAPTAANKQPFKVVFAQTKGREGELGKVYRHPWFVEPPLVAAVFVDAKAAWVRVDGANYGQVDGAIVMEHLVLAATALGLGTCWIANFDPIAARQVFGMESRWLPVALSPLGYPGSAPPPKTTKAAEEIVAFMDAPKRV